MREAAIVEAEVRHLETQIKRFKQGALEPELFKKLRLQYGIYSIRNAPTRYMVRVKVRLGIITPEQLEALADVCEVFTPNRAGHLTTRQDVQLYGVEQHQVPALLRTLARVGLTTREASGNVVRNVTLCPLAGVAVDEPFDITPYAHAVNHYFLRNPLTQYLPRKVKIAFEGCPTDHARTPIHDLGIVAALNDGRIGFRIYAGGGLGPAPRVAQLVEPWTSAEYLLPTVEAILRVFDRHGERAHRARARLKFLVEQMGWPAFQQRVMEERRVVWATQSGVALMACDVAAPHEHAPTASSPPHPPSDLEAFARWHATNVVAQKQEGCVCVTVRVPLGDLTASQLRSIARVARTHAGGIRLTNEQNLLLRFVPHGALPGVYQALQQLGLAEAGAGRLADVTRCPGADTCLSAITHPRGLAEAVERFVHNGLSTWADAPVSIKISGCPNACGHHHLADIGFFGVALKVGERHIPCYQMLLGGGTQEGAATFGQRLVRVPARRAPEAVKRLLAWYDRTRHPGESFAACVERIDLEPLQRALADLTDLASASHEPELFVDLGTTEPFQLEAGKGECAE